MQTKFFVAIAFAIAITTLAVNTTWAAQAQTYFVVLSGGNEVSDEGTSAVGDPNGLGSATVLVDSDRGMLCFAITVQNLVTPAAAHIHKNFAGRNGDIVVGLTAPSTGSPGSSSGCITGVNKNILTQIKNSPANFYLNVHTSEFPAGAIRGQLF
jgi:CHRD domain-containing protein